MKPILKIVAICVICAATLMSGCMDTAPEEKQAKPYVFVAHTPRIPAETPSPSPTPHPSPTPLLIDTIITTHLPDSEYSIYSGTSGEVYVCSHYGCDMAESLIDSGHVAGVVVDHADDHVLTWLDLNGSRYVIEPQTGECWIASTYEPKHNIDYVSLSKGREHAKESTEGLHTL